MAEALEEAGVPIGAEAGKGYFIMDGYYLPPVMFSQEEANALVLGAKLIEGHTDVSIKRNFDDALFKIKSVLKTQGKAELEKLEAQIKVAKRPQIQNDDFPNNFMAAIQSALISSSVLRFKYFSNYTGDFNLRDVEPIGLVFYANHWHLLAFCRMRQAPRDFRVDRLVKLETLEEQFDSSKRKPFQEFINEVMSGSELEEVIISVDQKVARYLGETKFGQGFVSERGVDDFIEMKFLVPNLDYFSRWLISLGDAAKVISPLVLIEQVIKQIKTLAKHYK